MGLGILLIPALGGYLFIAHFNGTRDRLRRESGYHLVFRSAVAGIALFAIAHILVTFASGVLPNVGVLREAAILWHTTFPVENSAAAALSVLLGQLTPSVLNPFSDRTGARRRVAQESGDHVGLVVDEAMETGQVVEISLAGGKSYVGAPLSRTFLAREDDGDLVMLPILSGYRHKDTRELELTVNYAPVLRKQLSELRPDDFRVAIPMREVVSARLFHRKAYDDFRSKEVHQPSQ